MVKAYITGHYGCKCHPFDNWKDCDKVHKQIFKVGDKVRHRCYGVDGVITEVSDHKFFYCATFKKIRLPSGYLFSGGLVHSAELLKIDKK